MIPEPFTYIAAGFGIAMTLLSATASTLTAAKQQIDKFVEYEDRIRRMRSEIQLSEGELEDCLSAWRDDAGELYSLGDCAELFGTARREELEEKVYQIISALAKVQQTLCFGIARPGQSLSADDMDTTPESAYEEAEAWVSSAPRKEVFAAQQKSWRTKIKRQTAKYKLLTKVIFVVWNGETIKARTEALRKSVANLRTFTDLLKSNLPKLASDSTRPSFAERVSHLNHLTRRWRDLSSVMEIISGAPFAVLPREPDSEGCIDSCEEDQDVTVSMLVETTDVETTNMERRIIYVSCLAAKSVPQHKMVENALRGECQGTASTIDVLCPKVKGKSMKKLYSSTAARSALDRARLQRCWEMERAETALSLITWTLLLWQTPWSKCMCTARLWRYPDLSGRPRISMLPCLEEPTPDGCSFEAKCIQAQTGEQSIRRLRTNHFRPTPTDREIEASRRKMISLAITLCEMALLCPIEIANPSRHPLQFICGTRTEVDENALLNLVEEVTMKKYREAVQLCFRYAAHPKYTTTTAAEIVAFSEKLLVPLAAWVSDVLRSRNVGKPAAWYAAVPEETLKAMDI